MSQGRLEQSLQDLLKALKLSTADNDATEQIKRDVDKVKEKLDQSLTQQEAKKKERGSNLRSVEGDRPYALSGNSGNGTGNDKDDDITA